MDTDLLHVSISQILQSQGELHDFIQLLQKEDLGIPVMFIFKLLKKLDLLPKSGVQFKIEAKSNDYREAGNKAFLKKKYSEALHLYNIALLMAPPRSRPLKLAFGNRSALFFTMKIYKACLADIKICQSLGYPSELMPKLLKRKEDCTALLSQVTDDDSDEMGYKRFFELTSNRHNTIPFASASIDVENGKVIAKQSISVGEVILEEQAYASIQLDRYTLICCTHCHRFSKNLIPCETCCYALFCNKDCMEQAWKESHKIECKIMSFLKPLPVCVRLSLKAILKAKNECSGWDELMKIVEQVEKSAGYCKEHPYKNLCIPPKINQIDRSGYLFNFAVDIAIMLYALSHIPSFISNNKKDKILHFLGSQLMVHTNKTLVFPISSAIRVKQSTSLDIMSYGNGISSGYFPFSGLLGHSCKPNVFLVGLSNKIVFIAQENIPKGAEIVVPHGGQFKGDSESKTYERKRTIFENYGFICKCERCLTKCGITLQPMEGFDLRPDIRKLAIKRSDYMRLHTEIRTPNGAMKRYQDICKGVSAYHGSKCDNEVFFYESFYRCIILFQVINIGQYVDDCLEIFVSYYNDTM